MAVLKIKDIKKMEEKEMEKKLSELRIELMKARTKIASGTAPENPGKVREIRKAIARILTKRREIRKK
ncbi:MAG: 50S ribosomal protein L29 [Candidatus Nanoarchaeia archaeon]|nr:50S ribosomal protein L29 [Candidatus Nanoarchaeia archaeon]